MLKRQKYKQIMVIAFIIGVIFLFFGCGHVGGYIYGMEKYKNIPKYKIPVKFCIVNDKALSEACIKNFPELFTNSHENSLQVFFKGSKIHEYSSIIPNYNGTGAPLEALSFFFMGLLPVIYWNNYEYEFSVSCAAEKNDLKLPAKNIFFRNNGLLAWLLPLSYLFPSIGADYTAVFSGSGSTVIKFKDGYSKDYCQVFVHLLGQIPKEKIEELYFSRLEKNVTLKE